MNEKAFIPEFPANRQIISSDTLNVLDEHEDHNHHVHFTLYMFFAFECLQKLHKLSSELFVDDYFVLFDKECVSGDVLRCDIMTSSEETDVIFALVYNKKKNERVARIRLHIWTSEQPTSNL